MVRPVRQDDRRPGVARILGVDDEDRDALVFRRIRVGAARQPDVVGVVGARGPHLLPVDDELVTMTDRCGAQRGQVGAGLRLGVTDGEMDVTGEDPGQKLLLLLVGAVHLQRGSHGLQRDQRQRHVGAVGLVDEDLLFDRAEAEPAVLLGPADTQLAVGTHPLDDRAIGLVVPVGFHRRGFFGRDERREVLAQFSLQLALFRGEFDVHQAPTRSRRCVGPPSSRVRSLMEE